jgi:hypothetical protein
MYRQFHSILSLLQLESCFSRRWIDDRVYFGNAVGRKTSLPGVFADHLLIGSHIDAVQLIIRHIAFNPLDLWAQLVEHIT